MQRTNGLVTQPGDVPVGEGSREALRLSPALAR